MAASLRKVAKPSLASAPKHACSIPEGRFVVAKAGGAPVWFAQALAIPADRVHAGGALGEGLPSGVSLDDARAAGASSAFLGRGAKSALWIRFPPRPGCNLWALFLRVAQAPESRTRQADELQLLQPGLPEAACLEADAVAGTSWSDWSAPSMVTVCTADEAKHRWTLNMLKLEQETEDYRDLGSKLLEKNKKVVASVTKHIAEKRELVESLRETKDALAAAKAALGDAEEQLARLTRERDEVKSAADAAATDAAEQLARLTRERDEAKASVEAVSSDADTEIARLTHECEAAKSAAESAAKENSERKAGDANATLMTADLEAELKKATEQLAEVRSSRDELQLTHAAELGAAQERTRSAEAALRDSRTRVSLLDAQVRSLESTDQDTAQVFHDLDMMKSKLESAESRAVALQLHIDELGKHSGAERKLKSVMAALQSTHPSVYRMIQKVLSAESNRGAAAPAAAPSRGDNSGSGTATAYRPYTPAPGYAAVGAAGFSSHPAAAATGGLLWARHPEPGVPAAAGAFVVPPSSSYDSPAAAGGRAEPAAPAGRSSAALAPLRAADTVRRGRVTGGRFEK